MCYTRDKKGQGRDLGRFPGVRTAEGYKMCLHKGTQIDTIKPRDSFISEAYSVFGSHILRSPLVST